MYPGVAPTHDLCTRMCPPHMTPVPHDPSTWAACRRNPADRLRAVTFRLRCWFSRPCSRTYFCSRVFRTTSQASESSDLFMRHFPSPDPLTPVQDLPVRLSKIPLFLCNAGGMSQARDNPKLENLPCSASEHIDEFLNHACILVQFMRDSLSI